MERHVEKTAEEETSQKTGPGLPSCILSRFIHFYFVSVGALPTYMSKHHASSWYLWRPEVLDPVELELQVVVSYHVGAGN